MTRVPHDHSSVETRRVSVVRHGGPRGRAIEFAGESGPETGDRVVVDGTERFAAVIDDRLVGVFDTTDGARDRDGTDRLPDWLAANDRGPGATVLLDVVDDGFRYGLRAPGATAVYDTGSPDSSLVSIAEDLGRSS